MLDTILAWVTVIAGLMVFLVVAGPASNRTFIERLFLWCVSMTLIGASLFRIVSVYDASSSEHATAVGYVIMLVTRCMIAVISAWMAVRWAFRCMAHSKCSQQMAGKELVEA